MLYIHFGTKEKEIYDPATYFIHQYEDEWITDELSREMISDVDKSEVIDKRIIDSPVLGMITPRELSGGVKTLILLTFDDSGKIFNATACGDNCAVWIFEIAKNKDLTINLHHIMDFSKCDDFEAYIINTGKTVHGYDDYLDAAVRIEER